MAKNTIKIKIKKGDTVLVISGKDKGKRGTVEMVIKEINKVKVSGVSISKHHLKPSKKNPHGGIIDKITAINLSNVQIICPRCSKPTRVGYKLMEDSAKGGSASGGKKMRICKKCAESIDG